MSGSAAAPRAGAAIIGALVASGVTDLVVSPGSRSAPLARAAAAGEREGGLRLHVRVDERSAGFLAVGIARVTGVPAAVICTSGTAVANLLPAVVEARHSGVPLVVITADRPPELRGRGASQTIDQVDIFGSFPLASRDLPTPTDGDWQPRLITDAVELAARARGPVHVNVPFRPPLIDDTPFVPVRPGVPREWTYPAVHDLGPLPGRGAILAGDLEVWDDLTRHHLLTLAGDLGWPIVAEASSGLLGAPGVIPGGTRVLGDPAVRAQLAPQMVISVGPFGLDRGVLEWLRSAERHVAVRLRPRTDPPDPLHTAELVVDGLVTGHVERTEPGWTRRWHEFEGLASPAWGIDAVAAEVWQQLAPSDLLLVAASSSIRALAGVARGPGPHVLANRGANGIDGLVSTAWGSATAWRGGRTVALLGDLAALHDSNGLLVPAVEPRPDLTLVVADDNGGGIFRTLEQGAPAYADTFDRVFGTPHDLDLARVLSGYGVPVTTVVEPEALRQALAPGAGTRIIVARLPRPEDGPVDVRRGA